MNFNFSYSSVTQYMECGKKWYFNRVAKVPETPAWWLVLGSTVHKTTEIFDNGEDIDSMGIMSVLDSEVAKAVEKEPNMAAWQKTYYDRAKTPEEMYYDTFDKAQEFHERWVRWRDNDRYEIIGVEVPIETSFWFVDRDTSEEVEITLIGYVDRTVENQETGDLGIVDLKTGKSTPPTDMQLGWYKVGLEAQGGPPYSWGAYWKADTGDLTPRVGLSRWDNVLVTDYGRGLTLGVWGNVFLPNLSTNCARCPFQRSCYAYSGPTEWSRKYDPLDPRYKEAQLDDSD